MTEPNVSKTADPMTDPENWLERYGDYLYTYALTRVHESAAAEDLVQETLLAGLGAREGFQGRSSVKTWLTGILKNKMVDYFRKKSREETVEDIEPVADAVDAFFDETGRWRMKPANWTINPMKLFEQKEFWKIFRHCLSRLSHRLSQVFTMREVEGQSSKEICKVLDISPTNLWVRLYRGRMIMRRCLEQDWFDTKG